MLFHVGSNQYDLNAQQIVFFFIGLIYGLFESVLKPLGDVWRAAIVLALVLLALLIVVAEGEFFVFGCLISVFLGNLFASCFA